MCWPASWVAKEIPDARLLSLEYAAPASGWEVRCVGLDRRAGLRAALPTCACGMHVPASCMLRACPPSPPTNWAAQHCLAALQGESLPFRHTVHQLMEKLAAAGVGQRPVIFVCHR